MWKEETFTQKGKWSIWDKRNLSIDRKSLEKDLIIRNWSLGEGKEKDREKSCQIV